MTTTTRKQKKNKLSSLCIIPSLLYYLSYFKWHAGWRETTTTMRLTFCTFSCTSAVAVHLPAYASGFVVDAFSVLFLFPVLSAAICVCVCGFWLGSLPARTHTHTAVSHSRPKRRWLTNEYLVYGHTNRGEGKTRTKGERKKRRNNSVEMRWQRRS